MGRYADIEAGNVSDEMMRQIRRTGVIIIRNTVPRETAEGCESTRKYHRGLWKSIEYHWVT